MITPDDVLAYWFGDDVLNSVPDKASKIWFGKDPAIDQYLKTHFQVAIDEAMAGKYDQWCDTPEGRLALIILLDQFSRNIYRETPRAFAQDAKALALAKIGVKLQQDLQLSHVERIFFYLPFEHSENKHDQEVSVKLFTQLTIDPPDYLTEFFNMTLDYALRHKEIIDRFGHFPHRSEIIGRPLSAAEREFLQEPNSSF